MIIPGGIDQTSERVLDIYQEKLLLLQILRLMYIFMLCDVQFQAHVNKIFITMYHRGRRGRDCLVVGFTTTYAISAYHHYMCYFESR
jgi:hypothetical protein